jgi:hypothetical protein
VGLAALDAGLLAGLEVGLVALDAGLLAGLEAGLDVESLEEHSLLLLHQLELVVSSSLCCTFLFESTGNHACLPSLNPNHPCLVVCTAGLHL